MRGGPDCPRLRCSSRAVLVPLRQHGLYPVHRGERSNASGSVVDLSDASSSPRPEPFRQVFLSGERGVRTARQRPHPHR
jgi:hypothetical protein